MEDKFAARNAGTWPHGVVSAISEVSQNCLAWQAHNRTTVKEALPQLLAVCTAAGVDVDGDVSGLADPTGRDVARIAGPVLRDTLQLTVGTSGSSGSLGTGTDVD
jgi:hypothetical protein